MYKVCKSKVDFQWITTENGLKFKIKPISLFSNLFPNPSENDQEKQLKTNYELFNTAVSDWEGIYDEKETPLECNPENKKIIFDFDHPLAQEVVTKAFELRNSIISKEEAENLKNLHAGSSTDQS
jgi:hypothetical protein